MRVRVYRSCEAQIGFVAAQRRRGVVPWRRPAFAHGDLFGPWTDDRRFGALARKENKLRTNVHTCAKGRAGVFGPGQLAEDHMRIFVWHFIVVSAKSYTRDLC